MLPDLPQTEAYSYCLVAENLAMPLDSRGFESRQLAREMVEGWKASASYRENLLLADATDIGVAVAHAGQKAAQQESDRARQRQREAAKDHDR